jgi:hypothetical protein
LWKEWDIAAGLRHSVRLPRMQPTCALNRNLSNFFYQTFIFICVMGRKKKYITEEERLEAKKARWNRWYEKNKQSLNSHRMKKYYERKIAKNLP